MKTHTIEKLQYSTPLIEQVKFDNEISLALESDPPFGPFEMSIMTPDNFINDPIMSEIN